MPGQLWKPQAFPELPRHFRKCQISANAYDIYTGINTNIFYDIILLVLHTKNINM